ncbi:MAG: protein phosphatase 2C domain-containing protein [Treponema sp.]|nr:protein phosphatase 2C domain-containing protein [Treponema sp.]
MVKDMTFSAFNVSCIGASHLKTNKPCQDYSACWNSGAMAIIAVADGHGAEIHSRSERGARFAVETAIECIRELLMLKDSLLPNPSEALCTLEKSIIASWQEKVADDIRGDPIAGDAVNHYGTTLLAAAVTQSYWFAIQIGDGKCVVINKNNRFSQPVPWDERCFLNRTTSICDENACDLFRHFYSEHIPAAIFIGSDGIDDSFPINENEKHLSRFYWKVFRNFIVEGNDKGREQLQEILPLFTQKGSGDDVSIAGIIRRFL